MNKTKQVKFTNHSETHSATTKSFNLVFVAQNTLCQSIIFYYSRAVCAINENIIDVIILKQKYLLTVPAIPLYVSEFPYESALEVDDYVINFWHEFCDPFH